MRNAYNILVGNLEVRVPLGRRRHRWEINIIMYLSEINLEVTGSIHLAQNRD
jgi:hypothetical protein